MKNSARLGGAFVVLMASTSILADQEPPYSAPADIEWQEREVTLPAYPKDEDLIEFPVGSLSKNRFSIDSLSLSVGEDGVVRYVLVVRAPGGGTNVTFEGIHCSERQYKVYAIGRNDQTWSKLRGSEWVLIENKPLNRHHAVLNRELFCPSGAPIGSIQEARDALRRAHVP